MSELAYQSGFGHHFSSEAIPNTLPIDQNSPQTITKGLYAEQLSGTAFTAARTENQRTWCYKTRPSVCHAEFVPYVTEQLSDLSHHLVTTPPNQMRWQPLPIPKQATHFIDGHITWACNGSPLTQQGTAIHLYAINTSMTDCFFSNSDGEMLFVPQQGGLLCRSEFGPLQVKPGEILVVPRGIKFQLQCLDEHALGYVCENFGAHFRLPDLGLIGANGLASARHFLYPTAAFDDRSGDFQLITKFQGKLWQTDIDYSPLNTVAWHGNYLPYKYDLRLFNSINTVSFDHPDPSIFTVLTSPSDSKGVANCDFVIFPERWLVAEHSFRPPYFHRNIMSEFMGLITGAYDGKQDGFVPGGCSLHNSFCAHGPDTKTVAKAREDTLKPVKVKNTLAFMFESRYPYQITEFALNTDLRERDYLACWQGLTPASL